MKDTHNITVPSVDELKRTVLPGLILDIKAISNYGDSAVSSCAMDRYSSLMEKNAVTELSGTLIGSIIVGTAGALALVYTPFKVMREGISLNSLLPLFSVFIFFSAFKFLPELIDAGKDVGLEATNTISETSKVTEYLNNDETEKLLDYLRSVNSGIPDKIPLINYVAAQASIKDGKVDIPLTKSVVDTYQAGASFIDIPGNVRYALEMAAFSKAVTPDAVSYEDNKNALVRQYSNLGKSSFFAGGILALIGLLILSCVRRLNQRVKFLNSFAYK
ncbi:hypothetical protein [Escherichia coli]|uniref:hypothetical protein n=1 Tax=Escherichia coli TaxID=562 RepID=UPI001F276097|nr:hypothetical protein [Escherichia coli]